jgi:hypothetical protein
MAIGRGNRMPPFLAVSTTLVVFGLIGLHLLARSNGWYWQAQEWWYQWYYSRFGDPEPLPETDKPSA